ncbi:alpha-ketoglutarate-dependent dioxygenase AlkB family protein [Teredinibacter sp. KSP-S5-2]|uniref:alpha-ketoglutarate-dependent dioxygenase AlkB family protein n=1 Tax=Teredinibacter sp. KSP-S5-2 TaxID=3034506 RepID=UPI002934C974|nr:alpha-ketoglutarate-dependent dioxygenase AlkB [Teredinibacter sp. KSP-S5-2]WNO08916.1 alpha-ketoglutarate-dependent dioxygenase AlkB [Teredinibacter sp. KSP-S5-2]
MTLFDCTSVNIPIENGSLTYFPEFIAPKEAKTLFQKLQEELNWQQDQIHVYGRSVMIPRLNAWYADESQNYGYSGTALTHNPWSPELLSIKKRVEDISHHQFNGMLANLYRDGQDSVSWHSDDEPELGPNPVIASVSLGESRRFSLKHRFNKQLKPVHLELESGSLLIMAGSTQHYWHHQVAKSRKPLGARINLTFRKILSISS